MPIYEFRCLACGRTFEKLFLVPSAPADLSCPQCQSESLERLISRANHVIGGQKAKPKVTTRSCHPGSDCTTLEIPGCD